jgi:peptide/nickel transport system permease protein
MTRYLVRQGLLSLIKLFVFITFMFFFVQLMMPGDFVDQFSLSLDSAQREALRTQLGLDLPIGQRYLKWLRLLITLELGESFYGEPIGEILKNVVPPTLLIFFVGTAIAFMLGLWLGKRTAWRGTSFFSRLSTLGGIILFTSFPPWLAWLLSHIFTGDRDFVLMGEVGGLRRGLDFRGLNIDIWRETDLTPHTIVFRMVVTLVLVAIFFLLLNLLLTRLTRRGIPGFLLLLLIGGGTVGLWYLLDMHLLAFDMLKLSWLAILTYTLLSFGETMLIMQSSMTEVMKEEYINTAHAKGLATSAVRERHAARNALLPALSRLVISLPYLLTGVVIIESTVAWPGMGTSMWNALFWQNMPVVMIMLLIVGVISLIARLFLDVMIAYLDPRIRYDQKQPSAI